MSRDIRRMSRAELDELNRAAKEWQKCRKQPAEPLPDALPEPSQRDGRESPVGEQMDLFQAARESF